MNFCRRPRARARRRACARSVGLLWQKGNPILPIMILFNRSDAEASAFSSTSPRLPDLHYLI
jgi:hypothetical protein